MYDTMEHLQAFVDEYVDTQIKQGEYVLSKGDNFWCCEFRLKGGVTVVREEQYMDALDGCMRRVELMFEQEALRKAGVR